MSSHTTLLHCANLSGVTALRCFVVAVLVAAAVGADRASATSVSPIQLEMTSAGSASRAQVKVTSSSQTPLALEASMKRMELDEYGRQSLSEAGAEFLIFPPQAMVPPGVTQVFRVEWVGAPDWQKARAFCCRCRRFP